MKTKLTFLLLLTLLPLLFFADTNTDWTYVISQPPLYLFPCWFLGTLAYYYQKTDVIQEPRPIIKSFLIAIGVTTFMGFSTYTGLFLTDLRTNDPRVLSLEQKREIMYQLEDTFEKGFFPDENEKLAQIVRIGRQIKRIKENNRHNQAVANYIFYTLSMCTGLLLGRRNSG
jgi:hypothetical protein